MKVLVTGAKGMLGRTILRRFRGVDVVGVDVEDGDITDREATRSMLASHGPDVVIHCAAMTAVDDCESKPLRAHAINATGSSSVAEAACATGARLIAISTDYVFSGDLDRPYRENDPVGPKSVYGQSKLAGEEAIRAACEDHTICRIAWLYGAGGPSFVHTMLRLGAQEGDPLKVVDDQVGNPTSCDAVADHLRMLLEASITGTVHLTCEGEATWFDFTKEIFGLRGLPREVVPCTSEEFPRPAPRPHNSRLENRALREAGLPPMPRWQAALKDFLEAHPDG